MKRGGFLCTRSSGGRKEEQKLSADRSLKHENSFWVRGLSEARPDAKSITSQCGSRLTPPRDCVTILRMNASGPCTLKFNCGSKDNGNSSLLNATSIMLVLSVWDRFSFACIFTIIVNCALISFGIAILCPYWGIELSCGELHNLKNCIYEINNGDQFLVQEGTTKISLIRNLNLKCLEQWLNSRVESNKTAKQNNCRSLPESYSTLCWPTIVRSIMQPRRVVGKRSSWL